MERFEANGYLCHNHHYLLLWAGLTGSRSKTASVAILNFSPTGVRGTLFGEAAAAAILIMLPALVLFFFLQRYFVAGLTFGAVKK